MCDKSHIGSYSQTAFTGPRRSRSQYQCSCHSPLPFASNTPKEQSGLQGTTCSSGQEGWHSQHHHRHWCSSLCQTGNSFWKFQDAQTQKRKCMLLHNLRTIHHLCVTVWKLKANHVPQTAVTKFKKTSLFCCPLLLYTAITTCAKEAVKIIYKKDRQFCISKVESFTQVKTVSAS